MQHVRFLLVCCQFLDTFVSRYLSSSAETTQYITRWSLVFALFLYDKSP